ncbi:HNH endonuclease family protein [Streptomyces benahoarensis]|uniref:HNH endonuclease n=1 Tax=Streptomyces benahoarensis TaxID=2595054 RepID=A0A553Y208_9ACTN|nr:HNH endonuclease family protein [Streptomyces benahoarensis]TSB17556.1 HNH endonuclease [Streptomyces benahoarensis]TSB23208.1 HNH endonuclease [Streptomyces benahoarensis]
MNRIRTALPAAAVAALLALTGCTPADGPGGKDAKDDATASGAPGGALAALTGLPVKKRASQDGYARDRFGSAWADTDGNGCGTRDDILQRDLRDTSHRGGSCAVVSGTLTHDPYTGGTIRYRRGSSKVDIDHVVALSDAWQKGAARWAPRKRIALANDPLNLIAVEASANRSKSDGDAAAWLPENQGYRCTYVARQVAVKKKYGMWVTRDEKAAMTKVLNGCPSEKLPTGGNPTEAPERFKAK